MKKIALLCSVVAVACAAPASATTTLGFDDVLGTLGSYGGYTFSNFGVLNGTTNNGSGYQNGVVSADNVAFNRFSNPASITSGTAFNLDTVYLTGAWNEGLSVQVVGTLLGNAVFTQTFLTTTAGPTLFTFNNASIDSAVFSSFGGTQNPAFGGSGTHFAMDNLSFGIHSGGGVPEPATWALMMVGFGLVGASMRRRQSVRVTYA
jgi:hypothetical protein